MYTHFRGTTFQFVGQFQNNGVTEDLSSVQQLSMSVHDKDGVTLYGTLTVEILSPATAGIIQVSFPDTSAWPVGLARIDATLTFNDGTKIASAPDFFRIGQSPMIG